MNKTTKVVIGSLVVVALSNVTTATTLNKSHNLKTKMILQEQQNIEDKYKKEIETLTKKVDDKQATIDRLKIDLESKEKTLNNIFKEQITLTFYTTLPEENGGYTTTSKGKPLRDGIVASNHYPIGTKIIIDGKTYTVADNGGSSFDSSQRLDVLVERQPGENDDQYKDRVNNLGKVTKTAYIVK